MIFMCIEALWQLWNLLVEMYSREQYEFIVIGKHKTVRVAADTVYTQ